MSYFQNYHRVVTAGSTFHLSTGGLCCWCVCWHYSIQEEFAKGFGLVGMKLSFKGKKIVGVDLVHLY